MPLFGAHMSIAGGYHNAVTAARDHDCTALQIFTKYHRDTRSSDAGDARANGSAVRAPQANRFWGHL
jgi:endonuclease IV